MATTRRTRERPRADQRHASRRRRHGGSGWTLVDATSAPVGPNISTPSLHELLDAIDSMPPLDWASVSKLVVPLLPRVRPYPPGSPTPIQAIVEPGLSIGFAIDIGPAFVPVNAEMLASWAITPQALTSVAVSNLAARAAEIESRDVVRQGVAGTDVRVLQSRSGCASALVLLPDELTRLFGSEPQVLCAPMRNLLIAVPADADRTILVDLFDVCASEDPNHLAPIAFRFAGGRVSLEPLEAETAVDAHVAPRRVN